MVAGRSRPPKGFRRTRWSIVVVPSLLQPSLPLLRRLSPVSSLVWRDPTCSWAFRPVVVASFKPRHRDLLWISLSKNTECPATLGFHYRLRPRLRISGVALEDTLTRLVRLAQGLTFARCHGSPRASSPHGLTAPGLASLDGIAAWSSLWLAVCYQHAPRRTFHLQSSCPCQVHLRARPSARQSRQAG